MFLFKATGQTYRHVIEHGIQHSRTVLAKYTLEDSGHIVGHDQLRVLDAGMHWVVEPGTLRVLVGASSKDIRLRGDLTVQ